MRDYHATVEQPSISSYPRTRSPCLRLSYLLKFISNAAIPLMIGVITLSIAIHQQKVVQSNRDSDATQAAELRRQDYEQGNLQREEDKKVARLQRTEDKETARLQRDLDLKIANDKRLQDNEISEQQRNLSEFQRTQESQMARKIHQYNLILEEDRRKESILFEYQNDLATLLLDHESKSNKTRNTWWFVLQMKTGAALRQLDPARRTILVQTLLEADLLDVKVVRHQDALLYTANLSGVQFSRSVSNISFSRYDGINKALIIPRADLRYASFNNVLLSDNLSLTYSNLDYTDWSFALIANAFFTDDMSMNEATFYGSQIYGTRFDGYRHMSNFHRDIRMNRVSFEYNIECSHCLFQRVSLLGIRLNHSTFYEAKFFSLSMADGNLSNGSFIASTFQAVTLDRIDLSRANLGRCKFIEASMVDCFMFGTIFQQTSFSDVNLTGCKGLDMTDKQILAKINFHQTTLPNGTFIEGNRG